MSFHFPYQKILHVKEKETESAQMAYGDALSRLRTEEETLRKLEQEKKHLMQEMITSQQHAVTASRLIDLQNYLEHVKNQIHKHIRLKGLAEQKAEQAFQRLTGYKKEEKKWSILKEQFFYRYIEEQKKAEQKQMDEVASRYYGHDWSGHS